jgi:membrane protein DedA with SNARE-associated domain
MLTFIGREVGANWEDWKDSLHYVDYTVAVLIVLSALYLVVRWRRNRNRGRAADAPA